VIAIAWAIGNHSHQSALGVVAASVMSAFAIGAAAFFMTAVPRGRTDASEVGSP